MFSSRRIFFLLSRDKKFRFFFFVKANYDPADDEGCEKNGHATFANGVDDNNPPITSQPTRLQRNISMNR